MFKANVLFRGVFQFCMIFSAVSQVVVQGIASELGQQAATRMRCYGTRVVAGVDAGETLSTIAQLPVLNSVAQSVEAFGAIAISVICVAPYRVLDAAREAMQAGVRQLVILTPGVPPLDMVRLLRAAALRNVLVVGAASAGVMVPGQMLLGVHPASVYRPGHVAILSRSDTLTYDVAQRLTTAGLGQSIAANVGADAIVGSTFSQWLQMLEADGDTAAIVLLGQVGGDAEELAAQTIQQSVTKPVVAYLAGAVAPCRRRLGHASTILEAHSLDVGPVLGTFASKTKALKQAGVKIAASPAALPQLLQAVLPPLTLLETA